MKSNDIEKIAHRHWSHNDSMKTKLVEAIKWLQSRNKWVLEGGKVNWNGQQSEVLK